MNTKLVIFDLDGTLLDTIGDLAVACNAVLALRGLPQHSYGEYCRFVGNGIMRLVERALPEELRTPENVALVRADFVRYYTEHIDRHTKPYAGIPELVEELRRRGVRLAVASNKFQAGTEKTRRAVLSFGAVRRGPRTARGSAAQAPRRRWWRRFSPAPVRRAGRCST